MREPAILIKVLDVAAEGFASLGPDKMPRLYYLNPGDWDAVREYAEKTPSGEVRLPRTPLFPRFTVETDLGDLAFQSSRFQQPGSFAAVPKG